MNTDEIDNYLALSSIDHSAWSYATSPHSVLTSISKSIISGADFMNLNNHIENSAHLVPSTISYKDYLGLSEKATNLYQPTMYNEWYKSSGLGLASTYSPSSVLSGLSQFGISLDHVGILNRPVSVSEYSVPIPSTISYKDYLGLGEKAINLYQPTTYNEWYNSSGLAMASTYSPSSVLSGRTQFGLSLDHVGILNRPVSVSEYSVPISSTFSCKDYLGLSEKATNLYQPTTYNELYKSSGLALASTYSPSSVLSGLTQFGNTLDRIGVLNKSVGVLECSFPILSAYNCYKNYLDLNEKTTNLYQHTTYNECYKSPVFDLASTNYLIPHWLGLTKIGSAFDHIGVLNRSVGILECSVPASSAFSYKNYLGLCDKPTTLYQLDTHNEWFKNPVSPLVTTQNPCSVFSYSDFLDRSKIEIERSTNYYQVNHKNCSTDLSSIQKLLSLADDNDIKKKVNCSISENAGNISVFIQINFYGNISGDRNHFGDKIIYQ